MSKKTEEKKGVQYTYIERLDTDQLSVAGILGPVRDCPLQRPEVQITLFGCTSRPHYDTGKNRL
jgi:hypothetical protein